jgi:hypothetical protein
MQRRIRALRGMQSRVHKPRPGLTCAGQSEQLLELVDHQ